MSEKLTVKNVVNINKSTLSSKENWSTLNYLDTGNITENQIDTLQIFQKGERLPSRAKRKVEKGTIIYSTVRPNQKHFGYFDTYSDDLVVSTGFATLDIIDPRVNSKYLYYLLTQNSVISQLQSIGENSTSSYPSIRPEDIGNLSFMFPDIDIQNKIADILTSIDKKIQINNQINQELEAMAKTLYDYWFVQFDFPDQNGKPYKSSGGKMVYNPELKREIPEGWRVTKLNEVVDLISGYPFSSNDYVTSGKYKLYTIKNVQDGYTVDKVDNYLDFLPSNMSDECQLRRGDLIMSLTGNVGRVGMVYEDYVLLNQRVLKLNPINKTHKSFIYSFFRSDVTKAHLENMSTGTSQKNLSPIDIGNMMIPFPSESLLSKFVNNLNMLENNLVENQQLTQLRDWLLPMLMNGQVKVE